MGMFDWDQGSVISTSHKSNKAKSISGKSSKKRNKSSSPSPSRSKYGGSSKSKHQSTMDSFLNGGKSSSHKPHASRNNSFFGLGAGGDDYDYRDKKSHYSRNNSFFGLGDDHHSSKRNHSFFGLGGDTYRNNNGSFFNLGNNSTRSFFGGLGNLGRSSYYKRSPRNNFMNRALKKLKRLLRDLVYYAKRHPMKVFMLVVMPLITGGALTALLARFGLRMPPGIERMLGLAAQTASGDGIGLFGEAVRMATGLGGDSGRRDRRERDNGMAYGERSYRQSSYRQPAQAQQSQQQQPQRTYTTTNAYYDTRPTTAPRRDSGYYSTAWSNPSGQYPDRVYSDGNGSYYRGSSGNADWGNWGETISKFFS